jgi:hypothetical protein
MAYFKEVTLDGGEKITINLDQVHAMRWFGKSTAIYFGRDHVYDVEETPAEILADAIEGRL